MGAQVQGGPGLLLEGLAAFHGFRLVALAESMGLVARTIHKAIDLPQIEAALAAFAGVGVARGGLGVLPTMTAVDQESLVRALQSVWAAVEESPLPEHEWSGMADILGEETLAELVGVSQSSLHRYRAGLRPTPDRVAGRLHFLALVASDLAGSYNDFGVRRWFGRSRSALDGRSPAELLAGDWDPDDLGPQQVRGLASALLSPIAT